MLIAAPPLILASTSRYRADLLRRLGLAFDCAAPEVDETLRPDEGPAARARRLAEEKAGAVAARYPRAWVIGSDQVCALGCRILRKPGSRAANIDQLTQLSGREAEFHTAVALAVPAPAAVRSEVNLTRALLRPLGAADIAAYVDAEPAWDCAGGFKAEGLGISLFASLSSDDPTALIGLPLIGLCGLLRATGWSLPLRSAP